MYHDSRAMIQDSMSLWDTEKYVFVVEDEAKASGSNITLQSGKRGLSRVKESEVGRTLSCVTRAIVAISVPGVAISVPNWKILGSSPCDWAFAYSRSISY